MLLQERRVKLNYMSKNDKQVKKILNNKTVHTEIPGTIHRKLRVLLFLNELSMQKFFVLMAEKYILGDNYLHELVEARVEEIKEDKLNKLKDVDEKDIYNAIEKNSPFGKK